MSTISNFNPNGTVARSLIARPLTDQERTNFILAGFDPPLGLPAWGAVFTTNIGKVLLFDGADGRRRYTLISGSGADAIANEINKPPYVSKDAGLIPLLKDIVDRGEKTLENVVGVVAIIGVIILLSRAKR